MIRRFEIRDLNEVSEWYQARKVTSVAASSLPEVGFIVPGVAVGFLYQTDSDLCLFEGVITNPRAAASERDGALKELLEKLTDTARDLGFKRCAALTEVVSIGERLTIAGFSFHGTLHLFAKEI